MDSQIGEVLEGKSCWVPTDSLKSGPVIHGPFPQELRDNYLLPICQTFADVIPWSMDEWEDNFRRDLYPGREISICLDMAAAFRGLTDGQTLSLEQKQGIVHVVLIYSMGGFDRNDWRDHFKVPATLSRSGVLRIIGWLKQNWGNRDVLGIRE